VAKVLRYGIRVPAIEAEVRFVVRVAVQQHQRFFRDGIGQLLAAERDMTVVGTAATGEDLLRLCEHERPEVVLLEVNDNECEVARLTAAIRRTLPKARVIGLLVGESTPSQAATARRAGMRALVSRSGGIAGILGAVRASGPGVPMPSFTGSPVRCWPPARSVLTARELTVLNLVGAGHTSREIAGELEISHKTVENHKQRIFAKLGVQNQAHAVSVAMRQGLMRPERIIGLALAE
jgi:DNA-binding NarL/FixJ family response regulator